MNSCECDYEIIMIPEEEWKTLEKQNPSRVILVSDKQFKRIKENKPGFIAISYGAIKEGLLYHDLEQLGENNERC